MRERYNEASTQVNEFGFKVNKVPMLKRSETQAQVARQAAEISGIDSMIWKAEKAWNKVINQE